VAIGSRLLRSVRKLYGLPAARATPPLAGLPCKEIHVRTICDLDAGFRTWRHPDVSLGLPPWKTADPPLAPG
jgi:hypothetical protein